jgi:thioredoxin reductase/NAD-dependent dihydropyrimidine dehydrogenase PreA subunit
MLNNLGDMLGLLVYFLPLVVIVLVYTRRHRSRSLADAAALRESLEAGLTEPASLHPLIDPAICIGCGACTTVCPEMPEHRVLGLVEGKAVLVSPTDCIGHGACQAACPVGAISLVFGSERRGVEIPHVKPDFQSNVAGIFIAGELGGMGLIRNAIEQGRQAMTNIVRSLKSRGPLDVLIVGAGPAGISASLAAMEQGLSYVTIEQDSLGGTVAHFPRGKLVMTNPATLPIVGKFRFREISKESLLKFWSGVQDQTGLAIRFMERVESIERLPAGFVVRTTKAVYHPQAILLAMGRRGTPRSLDVPGEELSKVSYRLADPEQYAGQAVLVVGGGDSALEAAVGLSEIAGTRVTLSYRSDAFTRAKAKNRTAAERAAAEGRLDIRLASRVVRIGPDQVELEQKGQSLLIENDAVIINVGGILPTGFLESIGIEVATKHGTR